jgi:hypothetical protein
MIGTRLGFGSKVVVIVACGLLFGGALHRAGAKPPSSESPEQANAFLDRFLGHWIGNGDFGGNPISDDLVITRALGDVFVKIVDEELTSGGFHGEIFMGYDGADRQYELYSFGSFTGFGGSLPVRVMTGRHPSEDVLVTEEAPAKQRLRYTFEFQDADTFVLTKAWVYGQKAEPFVVETFAKQP